MKLKLAAIFSILMLVGATSAVAITAKPQPTETKIDTQIEALAMQIESVAPRAASLDRPL